ncbi:MAG TPA: pyrimidine-nucleoside phosphorylase [Halanaerobiales bacterium]|nr:pyrimidine-nucleoside phosphorylase [Halanaerobiales bacterium]
MRPYDIIYKKREGQELSREEIKYLIDGFTSGRIPDYQISAWAMAVFFQGMSSRETADLTMTMVESGEQVDLSPIPGIRVDKHSTGGVGDTTTLVLAPLVAAAGVPVAKLSGRGLGHTGGTIDKLESIPGFRTELSREEFLDKINKTGLAVAGQTADLTPADRKLYALRDVTATVESISLIASSIMSKKLAGGADGIVLDVKTGNGAFMKRPEDARKLAEAMVKIGKELDKRVISVISDMNQPLGRVVGNALEVREAIRILKGEDLDASNRLRELCLNLGATMLVLAEKVQEPDEGYRLLEKLLDKGKALDKFREFVLSQGGNDKVIDDPSLLPVAQYAAEVRAEKSGYITAIAADKLGLLAMELGAGRVKKGDEIDPAVGLELNISMGKRVEVGDTLAVIHLNEKTVREQIINRFRGLYKINDSKPEELPLIYDIVQ